jgi:DNA polymerase delta subunit 1
MENYYRKSLDYDDSIKDLEFQAVEWHISDEQIDEDEPDKFVIRCFGVNISGNSICCTIHDFKPYFYIKVPKHWKNSNLMEFIRKFQTQKKDGKNIVNYYVKNSIILDECKFVMKKDFYGFHNGEEFKFAKLVFHSNKGMKCYMYGLKKLESIVKKDRVVDIIKTYDTNTDSLLKFFHDADIQPSNWLNIKKVIRQQEESSTCQMNFETTWEKVSHLDKEGNAPMLQASFDIETYSSPILNAKGDIFYPFPVPEKPDNVVYQVATCFKRLGDENFLVKHLLTLKKCNEILDKNVVVWECEDERDLLLKWKRLIELMDPDILYSYNGDMFDCSYMCTRAEKLKIKDKFSGTSRLLDYNSTVKESAFSSSAYGTSNFKRLSIPGRINFDILIFIKREFKENSYKLDNISHKYLGEKKNPVKVQDIFKAYETGDSSEIKRIGEYCLQDTVLPQKLVDTLHILQTQISMSNVTFVPIKYLIERGQQIKALSQIAKNSKQKNYLMPNFEYTEKKTIDDFESKEEFEEYERNMSFEGATVLEPIKGIYDTPITVLDFASLYPSIIRAHNLCYTTVVMEDKYKNIENVNYINVEIDNGKVAIFAQDVDSILPNLLADLAIHRSNYKRLMATASSPEIREIYNRTQMAYKVSMNSIYGILGSNAIGYIPIAASVTKIGRSMINDTKKYIESSHHNIYPEGHQDFDLDGEEEVTIKIDNKVSKIKVKDLENCGENLYIKTIEGWRQFYNVSRRV